MVSDAAMWMPGKSGRVIVEVIVTEIVQSSSKRNGSNSLVLPKPMARCNLTPAPSMIASVQ